MKQELLFQLLFFYSFTVFSQGVWTQKADFGGITRQEASGFSIGIKGYIGTGWNNSSALQDFWEWDPFSNIWTQKTNFGGGIRQGAFHFSIGIKGYLVMGTNGSVYYNDLWEWSQSTNIWTQKANFPSDAREDGASFSIGTFGYIGTGYSNGSFYKDFWEWDQSTNTWTQKTDFTGAARWGTIGFSIGNKGYFGTGKGTTFYNDFWEWDQSTNTWSQKANFGGTPRNWAAGFSLGTKGYIGTGDDGTYTQDFWEWDQANNSWTQQANFSGPSRYAAVGFSIDGCKGYIGTGSQYNNSIYYKDFWEYVPSPVIPCNAINVSVSAQNINCNGDSTGTATATPNGGTTPYSYFWSTTPAQTAQTATGLPIGTYTVTVTDSNSNTTSSSVTITQPSLLTAGISSQTNVACNGDTTGNATILAAGGTSGYNYSWSTTPVQTSVTATGLSAANYTVTITDINNCTITATVTITQPSLIILSTSSVNANCGSSDGSAMVSITSGGTSPFTYNWNLNPVQTNATATGLAAGIYSVTVTDANNCIQATTAIVNNNNAPTGYINNSINVTCYGGSNGQASILASGGTTPYNYLWDTSPAQTDSIATGLATGIYNVTVSDVFSCIFVTNVVILQPLELKDSVTSSDISCNGGNDGTATVTTIGGVSPYSYLWNTTPMQNTPTASTLSAGAYLITITDSKGCFIIDTIIIYQPSTIYIAISGDTNIIQNQSTTISVNVIGGTPDYSYIWDSGNINDPVLIVSPVETSIYCVSVSDVKNCIDSACIRVNIELPCGEIFVASIFSPNDDGLNDLIFVKNKCIKELLFVIYDRWGQKVFETRDKNIGWDGTYNNQRLNSAVFVYYLRAIKDDGVEYFEKGNITLLR